MPTVTPTSATETATARRQQAARAAAAQRQQQATQLHSVQSPQAAQQQQVAQQQFAQQQLAAQRQQQLGMVPGSGVVSPYDGTAAIPALAGITPGLGGTTLPGMLPGSSRPQGPQLNATNQTGLAPNGDVNQHVTNENQYVNKYYNIIVPNGDGFGGLGGWGSGYGGLGTQGNTFLDPQTGVLYTRQDEGGITGWFKRLFQGY